MSNTKLKNNPILEDYFKNPRFPLLYINSTNGIRVWACWVIKNNVYRTDGLVDGKLKTPIPKEIEANTLRSGSEQSLLEAEKLWIKQLDKGYKPHEKDKIGKEIYDLVIKQKEENGGMNRQVKMFNETKTLKKSKESKSQTTAGLTKISDRHAPMLAQSYLEQKKDIKFPVLVDPKLDGERVIVYLNESGQVRLESRNGKEYMFNNHIREAIKPLLEKHNIVLDGELYIHELYKTDKPDKFNIKGNGKKLTGVERYQFISKACKISRKEPHPEENLVQLWIFDIYDLEKTAQERKELLKKYYSKIKNNNIIKLVPFEKIDDTTGIDKALEKYTLLDFEGIMLRPMTEKYISKGSYHCKNLLKLKKFIDEELEIIGASESKGTQKGAIIWQVQKNGKTVNAKQIGSVQESKKLWEKFQKNPNKFIGKMINIRYNETTKDGLPRFPRATGIVTDKF